MKQLGVVLVCRVKVKGESEADVCECAGMHA